MVIILTPHSGEIFLYVFELEHFCLKERIEVTDDLTLTRPQTSTSIYFIVSHCTSNREELDDTLSHNASANAVIFFFFRTELPPYKEATIHRI